MPHRAFLSETFLHPGDIHFGFAPGRIGTLLGSCVAVSVWNPETRFGGLSHIILPGRKHSPGTPLSGRYADEAVAIFAQELKRRNIAPRNCQVKLFGGGNMFAEQPLGKNNIGHRNIEATRLALSEYGFVPISEHVGGTQRRRLFLDLGSGHVWLSLPNDSDSNNKENP
jgi:chemotaxis protein CheD